MSTKKETMLDESHRVEIEISVVLLGFVFVMYSIFLTMPSDVLILLNQVGITVTKGDIFIEWIRGADVFSQFGLYCALSLLGAVLLYIMFMRFKKEVILLTARSLLAFGLFSSVVLLILINALYSIRLVGVAQVNISLSPFASVILTLSAVVISCYLGASWGFWLYKYIKGRFSKSEATEATTVKRARAKLAIHL